MAAASGCNSDALVVDKGDVGRIAGGVNRDIILLGASEHIACFGFAATIAGFA